MKKHTPILFVVTLFVTLLGFSNSTSAMNCAPGESFNTTTGQSCGNITVVSGCQTGYLFNPTTGQPCPTIFPTPTAFRDLTIGSRGDDVRAVQQILKDEGYFFGKIDGRYGRITARAVGDFQDDNGLPVTGNVDVTTQIMLNIAGNLPPTLPPFPPIPVPTVASPACTSFPCFFDGVAIRNTWSTVDSSPSDVSADYPYEFRLSSSTAVQMTLRSNVWPAVLDGSKNTMFVEIDNRVVFQELKSHEQSLADEQSDNTVDVIQLGQLSAGKHYIKIYASPAPKHFMFDWFKLEPLSTSAASPVISGVSGPQSLKVNEQGTWSVSASDSSGGNLSYSVIWGDEGGYYYGSYAAPTAKIQQSATFTHSYSQAGNYSPVFYVTNTSGQTAKTSLSVNVGAVVAQPLSCSLLQQTQQYYYNICKNSGFENVCFSKDGVYQGCSNNASNDCTVNNSNASTNLLCSVGATSPTIITSTNMHGTISPSGQVSVPVGSNQTFTFLPDSGYQVSEIVIDNSGSVSVAPGASSYTFYNVTGSHIIGVVFSPVPTQSSIQVLSPNGGEQFSQGQTVIITWTSTGGPDYVGLNLIQNDGQVMEIGNVSNIGSYSWTIPSALFGNGFKIKIYGNGVVDDSNAPFTITGTTITASCTPSPNSATPVASTRTVGSITITSPNGGECLTKGSAHNITWTNSSNIDKITIGLVDSNGTMDWIANNIANTGSYNWNVSKWNTTNTKFKIYILGYHTGVGSVSEYSDNFFTVN